MTDLLLCSNNQLLTRSLYGMLRDEGYGVETAEHPSLAVQMVLKKTYAALIIDSEPFGLTVDDAIKIIRTIVPDMLVIFIGYDKIGSDALSIESPLDLDEFKRTLNGLHTLKYTH
ncbi:MAG: hypothetical protein HZB33_14825 [Nitrospirae bacterium]|nr:hypothetical protein [Nitrospirota bacterium]